jgi:hypothetical protein
VINSTLIEKIGTTFVQSKYSRTFFDLLLLIWTVWVLFPLLDTGLVSDDAYNSQINGAILTQGVTLWQRIWEEIVGWAVGAGRLCPLGFAYVYGLYYLTQDVFLIKGVTLLIICIDILLFSTIIRFLTRNQSLAYLCAFLVPLFFQFRFWHDPILGFTFLMPLMCMFLLSSILFLIKYLEQKKNYQLTCFALIYLISLLTYEITYAFGFLYIPIIFFHANRKRGIKILLIAILLTVIHILLARYIYSEHLMTVGHDYPGAKLNLDIIKGIHALYIQATSALPLSWKFANAPFHQKFYQIGVENLITYAVFATLFCTALFKFDRSSLDKKTLYKIITFSFFTLVLPALVIAFTGHQKELIDAGFGYGYTPVFIQYFGLCVLILFLLLFVKDMSSNPNYKKIFFVLIWIVVFSVGAITREENILIVEESNKFYKYPRELLGESIKKGILDEVQEPDLILRNHRYPSDYYWFYSMKTNKKLNLCGLNIEHQFPHCLSESYKIAQGLTCSSCKRQTIANANSKLAILMKEVIRTKFKQGVPREEILSYFVKEYGESVVVGKLSVAKEDSSKIDNQKNYGLSYFVGKEHKNGSVILAKLDNIVLIDNVPIEMPFTNYKIYNSVDDTLLHYSTEQNYDFLKVLQVEPDIESKNYDMNQFLSEEVVMGFKAFHREEGNIKEYNRWSSGHSTIIVLNKTKSVVLKVLKFDLIRPNEDTIRINVRHQRALYAFDVHHRKSIDLSLNLKPGVNYIEFTTNAPHIDNGDPRNIVFGVASYKLGNP